MDPTEQNHEEKKGGKRISGVGSEVDLSRCPLFILRRLQYGSFTLHVVSHHY